jgi:hypothetical protein
MFEDNNLHKVRPEQWTQGSLFPFIEECWSNSIAVVGNHNVVAARLSAVDSIFQETHQTLKPTHWSQIVPALLMMRSMSAFRSAVMVGSSLPVDSYPLQRSCLESAGYANLIATEHDLSRLWLCRDDDPAEFKRRFTNRAVRDSIAAVDAPLAAIYQELYERSIEFGAHPNEKGVLSGVLKESIGTGTLQFYMLAGDGPALQHALRMITQSGICVLRVLNLIFAKQFEEHDFANKIKYVSTPF